MKEVLQRNLSQTAEQPATTKAVSTNALPNRSPALIPCHEDEIEPTQQEPEPVTPCPPSRKYNLRTRAVNTIYSVLLEESPNTTSVARPPKHIN
eukprot:10647990-Ditylum_brightwellii.AAC.1